ncbi:MAG: methionine adenosyltransferase [Bdellovibrionota bacterium]
MKDYFFTSESVSEGHPDKVADQISDAILDSILAQDAKARVACETMVSTGRAIVSGEITTSANVDFEKIVRKTIQDIGYDDPALGFDDKSCQFYNFIGKQSPDIAMGVDRVNEDQGAGDQGIMFGYAVNETPEFMPLTISYAHKLVEDLAKIRKSKKVNFLRPDSKSQVTFEYKNGVATRLDSVVISTQHSEDVTLEQLREFIVEEVVKKTIPSKWFDAKTKFYINPTGRFVIGGPTGDCGLTGRKIIVDTYGGHGAHGGGAFSGKDPSKVDRSAAYAARNVAKTIVAAGLAEKCLIQLSYAIGVAHPLSVMVQDYGTAKVDVKKIEGAVSKLWDLRPAAITKQFDLIKPKYLKTAAYGHFGRNEDSFTWEKTDKAQALKDLVK